MSGRICYPLNVSLLDTYLPTYLPIYQFHPISLFPLPPTVTAIAETEARHETWALLDIWGASPFAGPADTSFPYANPILDTTRPFVVAGSSCPAANPPVPATAAEPAGAERRAGDGVAGAGGRGSASRSRTRATSRGFRVGPSGAAPAATTPSIFRGVANVSVAIDASRWAPAGWERDRVVVVDDPGGDPGAASRPTGASSSPVVADAPGAPTEESVVAGPGIMLEQPAELGAKLI